MTYSDKDLMVASQLSYFDFTPYLIKTSAGKDHKLTVKEAFEADNSFQSKLDHALETAKDGGSQVAIQKAEQDLTLYNEIKSGKSEYSSWVIKDVKDDNAHSGFYGLVIETEKNSAIVGFRGSEGQNGQFEKDWLNADFKMLNSTHMKQQDMAAKYMAEINKKFNYDQYATAGHSLGGNLSFHAAITAPKEMRGKIIRALSADGPGYSNEYLSNPAYAEGIKDMAGKMTHYQWSLVGALLHPIPGATDLSIKTNDKVYGKYDLGSLTTKHSVGFVEFDENGHVLPGKMDRFAASIGKLSKEIEDSPSGIGNALVNGIIKMISLPKKEKIKYGVALIGQIAILALTHPVAAIATVVAALTIAVIGYIDPEFYGEVLIPALLNGISSAIEMGQKLADGIQSLMSMALAAQKFTQELRSEIIAGVINVIISLSSWIYKNLNSGYRYATSHPVVKVDTNKLQDYAQRLQSINRRINSLDHQLDSLYTKVGFFDLWHLIQADLLTSESPALQRCISYLEETASSFETAERNITNRL